MPRDSNWKMATVLPDENTLYEAGSSSGMAWMSNCGSPIARMCRSLSAMMVSVVRPRKSNFTSPAFSTSSLSNWLTVEADPSAQ